MANRRNNKQYRKQKQRQTFPWLFVVLGGGLLLVAAVFLANRSGGDGGGTPSISVDQNKIDYGYVKFGENRQFALKVTNAGDGTLRFSEQPYIEVLEGC
jgi:hypothetical protein